MMEVFSSKKGKTIFITYFIISFIIFIYSAFRLNELDKSFKEDDLFFYYHYDLSTEYILANLFVLIPLTYIIMLSFLIMKYRMYKAHKNRYRSFYDYSIKEQEEFLKKSFCNKCNTYNTSVFKEEKMIEGMRWVYCECKECKQENKIRLT